MRLRPLKKPRTIKNKFYRKVLLQEEMEWFLVTSTIIFLPFAVCLLILHLQNVPLPFYP